MAEVAVCISNGSDPAIAEPGKGPPPKKAFPAAGSFSGAAQNMCRTVIVLRDVVLPGRNFVFAPRAAARGFFI